MCADDPLFRQDVDKQERDGPDDGGTRPEHKFQGNTNASRGDPAHSKSVCW